MNIIEDVINCQTILYKGFTSTKCSGISWLNEFCAEFLKLCNKMQKFIIFECNNKENIPEICFLCMSQIVTCIKYLEKAIAVEDLRKIVLTPTRQHFLDRMLWCLTRLKTALSGSKDISVCLEETNFVEMMDTTMELISPYTEYNNKDIVNKAEYNAEIMFVSKQIRSTVDSMLSQILAFANVALVSDKKALTALCQKVLKECISFQEECSLDSSVLASNYHNRQLKAGLLETALLQLEDYINESLLRLVYKVFVDQINFCIDDLRKIIKSNPDDPELDDKIADFDVNIDRIIQIGVCAIAFAPNVRIKNAVRSALASIESLDSCLIPSIYLNCNFHSTILEEHYYEEIKKFQTAIQDIIDSFAFCSCFYDILDESIKKCEKVLDKILINEVLDMAKLLKEHLTVNFGSNKFNQSETKKRRFEEYVLMIDECTAVLSCADQVEHERILKRLKILRSTVKKLKKELENTNENEKKKITNDTVTIFINSDDFVKTQKMFESFGITPSTTSIFYKTKRGSLEITDSLKGNTSKLKASNISNRIKVKRKESLRTAMFKRQKDIETKGMLDTYYENSTSLQITDILDQITCLSSSFSKPSSN